MGGVRRPIEPSLMYAVRDGARLILLPGLRPHPCESTAPAVSYHVEPRTLLKSVYIYLLGLLFATTIVELELHENVNDGGKLPSKGSYTLVRRQSIADA